MTAGAGVPVLATRAAEAAEAASSLFSELRDALAAALGIELIEIGSRSDGTWMLTCRFGASLAAQPAPVTEVPVPTPGAVPCTVPDPPEPPFVSPVLSSAPFDGDGSNDLVRFIEEADPGVRVPPAGEPGELPAPLGLDDRARMLATTIAGDVVLALMHEGTANDPASLGAALDAGWERYTAEVRRLGREPDAALYREASELAAAMIAEGI